MARRGLTFVQKEKKLNMNLVKKILEWIFEIAVVLFLAFVLVYFFGEKVVNVGESMSPTLENGDTVLVNKLNYSITGPSRGDVVVFKPHGNENTHYYIKRVIGLPGETVEIRDGKIYIDGEVLEEELETEPVLEAGVAASPVELGEDEYFVLGDNRNNSEDSRSADVGDVLKKHMLGKAWFVLSPKERFGYLK
ncbi:signal peptidase I [Diplocloster agilis]|uniref:Signal peptidase I n=1 Tax=Diplocloster agilis TaxID=2850323 RepID=A0A949K1N0_9FIRM|nr:MULTISPECIES: signal peptidase I [Lachnospiraceae]MBU9737682.1 signal peptidase I [Diplocloster agilis]MCU6735283.1 signal peptidase I [Suonthocola fibrivorans]SCJ69663.1 Signal peptidase I S [uncultured Clostridium sp.]